MMWGISLAEGWAMILAGGLLHGEAYIWPDARLSANGRKLLALAERRARWQSGEWKPEVDL